MVTSSSPRRGQAQTQQNPAQNQTRTQTQTQTRTQAPVLRLRGAAESVESESSGRRVQWAEGVVNNEGMGRKSSKVCCIYHAPKGIDESSDESSSDSDESESGDDGAAKPTGGRRHVRHGHDHDHGKGKARARSPNAYEKLPKAKGGGSSSKENRS